MFPSPFYALIISLFHSSFLSSRPVSELISTADSHKCYDLLPHMSILVTNAAVTVIVTVTHLALASSACSSWRQMWRRML